MGCHLAFWYFKEYGKEKATDPFNSDVKWQSLPAKKKMKNFCFMAVTPNEYTIFWGPYNKVTKIEGLTEPPFMMCTDRYRRLDVADGQAGAVTAPDEAIKVVDAEAEQQGKGGNAKDQNSWSLV